MYLVNGLCTGMSSVMIVGVVQGKEKRCAFVQFGLGPNTATVALDHSLHDCQANSGTLKFIEAMEPLKDAEKFVGVAHIETGAVVLDEISRFAVLRPTANLDARVLAFAGKFQRVGNQVGPDLLEQRRIGLAARQRAH